MNRQFLLFLIVVSLFFGEMFGTDTEEIASPGFIQQEISFNNGKNLLRGTLDAIDQPNSKNSHD